MTNSPWLLLLGANSDMAIATAHRYAQEGYNLYLASRNTEELEKTAKDIEVRYQTSVRTLAFDAADFDSHQSFYNSLEVQPAGLILAFGVMFEQAAAQQVFSLTKQMIDVNYTGAVSILEIAAADFEQRKTGFIVGISSVAGDRGRMSNYLYGSTKAALTFYLAGLRHRLAKSNITVLTVKPGFVATKMTENLELPAKLTAHPNEVAEAIFKAVLKRKSIIYIKPIWWLIMLIITNLPDVLFHKTKI